MLNSKVRMRHQTAFNTNYMKQANWELPIEKRKRKKKTCSKIKNLLKKKQAPKIFST